VADDLVDAGSTAWVVGTTDKDACWDQAYADREGGDGNGWVEGPNNSLPSLQEVIRQAAEEGSTDEDSEWFGIGDGDCVN
jgi:hypothetical protein